MSPTHHNTALEDEFKAAGLVLEVSPPSVLKGSETLITELQSWMTENLHSHYYHGALLVHNHRPFNVLSFHWDVCKRVTGQDKAMSIKTQVCS